MSRLASPTTLPVRVLVHIAEPGRARRSVLVSRLPTVVGSDPACDIVVAGHGVAPRHLELHVEGLQLTARSLIERGGAAPDDDAIAVAAGAVLTVGDVTLRALIALVDDDRGLARLGGRASASSPSLPRRAATHEVNASVRRAIHRRLLERLDLARLDRARLNDHLLRAKVEGALRALVAEAHAELPADIDPAALVDELVHEAIGLGPLDALLADPTVSEIMVLDAATVYVERDGRIERSDVVFTDDAAARAVLERVVAPLGRRIDESSPMLDARLADGSRVNAVIRPLALRGTCITIRKFPTTARTLADLERLGGLSPAMARFLVRSIKARKNILIAGGTGSGKTTLLNALSQAIDPGERIVTIEDAAELRLQQPHVVALEARPSNFEGAGQITIRELVRNAMRMRPDRIIVGECRGGEALDMLQAMNTGHDGSMSTTHANSPCEALKRIEMLAMMSDLDVPSRALREQIAVSLDLIVQQTRFADGTRRITSISEVIGLDGSGEIIAREIFGFRRTGIGAGSAVLGEFYATGYLPSYLPELVTHGLLPPGEPVL